MKAKEFISETLLSEFKFLDRLKAGDELNAAVRFFEKIRHQYDDPYEAMRKAAQMTGVRARVLQTYLKDAGLLENEMNLHEGYIAFELDERSRQQLAQVFEPKYPEWIGRHITHQFGVGKDVELPELPEIQVIGYVDDGDSLEALVVAVNGSIERPDGGTYHITWSLDRDKGRKPVHSNDLIATQRYKKIKPIPIEVEPKLLG